MGDAFRSFILGLGILLGLAEGGTAPKLEARIFRDGGYLRMYAKIENGISDQAKRIVNSGNTLSLVLLVRRDGKLISRSSRTIVYTPENDSYLLAYSETSKTVSTAKAEAAYVLLSEWEDLRLEPLGPYRDIPADDHVRLSVQAIIIVNDAPWEDSRVLWNYKCPERVFVIRSLAEVPY